MISECKQTGNCGGGQANGICGYDYRGRKKTWCRHPSCVSSAPTATTLTSPANGSIVTTNPVHLTWSTPSNWGAACSAGNHGNNIDTYYVYAGSTGNIDEVGVISAGTNYFDYTVPDNLIGTKIYWYVSDTNGCVVSQYYIIQSATWNFTLQGGIQGKVYYDANNNCSNCNASCSAVDSCLTNLQVCLIDASISCMYNLNHLLPNWEHCMRHYGSTRQSA